jgi:hypothetical protein
LEARRIPALRRPLAAQVATSCRTQQLPFVANPAHTYKRRYTYKGFQGFVGWARRALIWQAAREQ